MDSYQSILQKAPPADLGKNLKAFREMSKNDPDALESLSKKYPFPFPIQEVDDDNTNKDEKPYLQCQHNIQPTGTFRSPWTNLCFPGGKSALRNIRQSSEEEKTRAFELKMNHVWEAYKNLYYGQEDAVGSVFLEPWEKGSFQGFFGIQKNSEGCGSWSSMHIVQVGSPDEATKTCAYKVESTCLMVVEPEVAGKGSDTTMEISAVLSKDVSKKGKVRLATLEASHIENLGQIIEANEIDLRSNMERVHAPKTQEIMDKIQKVEEEKKHRPAVNPLMGMIMQSDVLKKKLAKQGEATRG